jgi:uncharacterized membrane protein
VEARRAGTAYAVMRLVSHLRGSAILFSRSTASWPWLFNGGPSDLFPVAALALSIAGEGFSIAQIKLSIAVEGFSIAQIKLSIAQIKLSIAQIKLSIAEISFSIAEIKPSIAQKSLKIGGSDGRMRLF